MKKNVVFIMTVFIFLLGIGSGFSQTAQEEAKRYFDRAMAAVEMAKSPEDYILAIKEFEQAATLAPDWPDVYYNLGMVQEKAEKYGDAIANLKQYLKLAPNARDAEVVKTHINKLEYKAERLTNDPMLANAAFDGRFEEVKQWIAKGAGINARTEFADGNKKLQWTPLLAASYNGHKEIVELLIANGADINVKDENDFTPLIAALVHHYCEVAELLIAKGAEVNVRDYLQWTPLHYAAYSCSKEVVELLIAKGADINARTEKGSTPLTLTKRNESFGKEVAKVLKRHGAEW